MLGLFRSYSTAPAHHTAPHRRDYDNGLGRFSEDYFDFGGASGEREHRRCKQKPSGPKQRA